MLPELKAGAGVAGPAPGDCALEQALLPAERQVRLALIPDAQVHDRHRLLDGALALKGPAPEDVEGVVAVSAEADALFAVRALVARALLVSLEAKRPAATHQDGHVALPLGELAGSGFHRTGVVVPAEEAVGLSAVCAGRSGPPQQGQAQA